MSVERSYAEHLAKRALRQTVLWDVEREGAVDVVKGLCVELERLHDTSHTESWGCLDGFEAEWCPGFKVMLRAKQTVAVEELFRGVKAHLDSMQEVVDTLWALVDDIDGRIRSHGDRVALTKRKGEKRSVFEYREVLEDLARMYGRALEGKRRLVEEELDYEVGGGEAAKVVVERWREEAGVDRRLVRNVAWLVGDSSDELE